MPIPAELKLTYDDYLNLPDDGKRHEIVDGEHFMTPAPQTRHQIASKNLQWILESYTREKGSGHVLDAPIDVLLSDTTVVQPDMLFVRKEREHIIKQNFIEGPPDLVVEIQSPGDESEEKLPFYAELGVRSHTYREIAWQWFVKNRAPHTDWEEAATATSR